jgi:predicted O-methyltransferase YrrM
MDLLVSGLMINGNDEFRSGKKLGKGYRSVGDLEYHEIWEYITPFVRNIHRYDCEGVVVHDGLSEDFVNEYSSGNLKFEYIKNIPAHHANYERRHFAYKAFLENHTEIERLWLVDANDIGFIKHPFEWLADTKLAVGEEWTAYNVNKWFIDGLQYLPLEYSKIILEDSGERYPVNCGAWGGTREEVYKVLVEFCDHLEKLKHHVDENPPPHSIVLDMHAFAGALLYKDDLKLFKMDGQTIHNGVPSPLTHDRKSALNLDEKENNPLSAVFAKIKFLHYLPGWCQESKAMELLQLVLRQRPRLCVEIGVHGGRSLIAQALGLQHLKRGVIYGIDPWRTEFAKEGNQHGSNNTEWNQDNLNNVYDQFMNALTTLSLNPYVRILCGASQDVCDVFENESIDILHIDGNHAEIPALRDVTTYLPKVRQDGWIWFDDTDWESTRPAIRLINNTCDVVGDWENYRLYRKKVKKTK